MQSSCWFTRIHQQAGPTSRHAVPVSVDSPHEIFAPWDICGLAVLPIGKIDRHSEVFRPTLSLSFGPLLLNCAYHGGTLCSASIHPSIHPSIYPCIHPSTHPPFVPPKSTVLHTFHPPDMSLLTAESTVFLHRVMGEIGKNDTSRALWSAELSLLIMSLCTSCANLFQAVGD